MDIDLVRRLRICADNDKSCKDCGLCETNKDCYNTIVKQAADCIEGMSRDLDRTKDYLEFILEQLSGLEEISFRAMMGEYILYYKGKVFGGIYDNRFRVKPTKSAKLLMPDAPLELPYDGAKEMLLVDNLDDKEFLAALFNAMVNELPAPKKRKSKR